MNYHKRLFFGKPIPLDDKVSVTQPKLDEIIELDDKYEKYLSPFILTMESLFEDEEIIESYDLFDLFFEKNEGQDTYLLQGVFNGNPIEVLSESIKFFTGQEVTKVLENRKKIVIGDSYIVDKIKFKDLRAIIQAISGRKDIVVEKMPKGLSERRQDIWKKLHEGRKRKAQREAMKLEDIANVVSYGGKSYIPLQQILDMTYYTFLNAYKSILDIDSYYISLEYKVSQKYEFKDDLVHWSKSLKVKSE